MKNNELESNHSIFVNNTSNKKKSGIINISEELKEFLNTTILYRDVLEEIDRNDIKEIFDVINKKNETRTNIIRIKSTIVDEFFKIINENIEGKEFILGEIEIDICNQNFNIQDFVKKYNKILYNLKLKINSIEDLEKEDPEFLSSRYGIIYVFCEEEYHYEELQKIVNRLKEFIPNEFDKNFEGATQILNNIHNKFELYQMTEYAISENRIHISNLKFIADNGYYSKLENIFKENKGTVNGMRKLCREVLRTAGFDILNVIESISNTIKKYDINIDNKKYQIIVEKDRIWLK